MEGITRAIRVLVSALLYGLPLLLLLSAVLPQIEAAKVSIRWAKQLPPVSPPFRIMSYNIRSGSNISDIYNLTATAEAINSFSVDLVGLQEVDNDTSRHPGQDQPVLLGQQTGMAQYYGVMRDFEGGFYGIAALSRLAVLDAQIFRYSNPNSTTQTNSQRSPRRRVWISARDKDIFTPPEDCGNPVTGDYCQGILALRVALDPLNATQIWFATTHIGIGTELQEALEIHSAVSALQPQLPLILTGDFNSLPGSPAIQFLTNTTANPSALFTDIWMASGTGVGYTFNSSIPLERIDYQLYYQPPGFVDYRIQCNSIEVGVTEASDHRPVVASYSIVSAGNEARFR